MKIFNRKIYKTLIALSLVFIIAAGTTSFVRSDFQISKNLEIFATLLQKLHTNYVDEIKTGELVETGINAMLQKLDPYTVYIQESEIEEYKLMTTGKYGGIGSTVQQRGDHVQVTSLYEGYAAEKAGLRIGDRILKVDKKNVEGKSSDDVSNLMKGQAGSEISLTIYRPVKEDTIEIKVKRENIKVPNIPYSGMLENKTGYIKLSSFTQEAGSKVKEAFLDLKENNELNGLIIDLRNNGGGLLGEAVKIVNLFVPKGELVVETRGKLESKNNSYYTTSEPLDTSIPLVILVNGNSASASEIIAGAIQDLDRGLIIGEKTFGKGLVQNIVSLNYNTRMKVTVAKYYIPSGRCIQAVDYSTKQDAKVSPDSLKRIFETKSGRIVYDGAGIYPDIEVPSQTYQPISKSLVMDHMIFDFATLFQYEVDSIQKPSEYTVSEQTYNDFSEFLTKMDFEYQTDTEKSLEKLTETAKEEKYLQAIEGDLESLKNELHHDKAQDLQDFKDEITGLLRLEIVSRYYHMRGKVISSLKNDKQTLRAIELLNDPDAYNKLLKPQSE